MDCIDCNGGCDGGKNLFGSCACGGWWNKWNHSDTKPGWRNRIENKVYGECAHRIVVGIMTMVYGYWWVVENEYETESKKR